MSDPPPPLRFASRFKPRPWGGRMLSQMFGKPLPAEQTIGESWELSDLPEDESLVAEGPLRGVSVGELIRRFGAALVGRAPLCEGRFPLLIKWLDARENLSVQVHPANAAAGAVKHEAWFVAHAEPHARLYLGFREGVTPADAACAANSPAIVDLLHAVTPRVGDCYYLPSGLPHALGAGVVVAEVQTPSDVTYRLYDWDRVGLDGRPRELHIDAALASARFDIPRDVIMQPRSHVAAAHATISHLVRSDAFCIDRARLAAGVCEPIPHAEMTVWIVLAGCGEFRRGEVAQPIHAGDVVLLPASTAGITVSADTPLDVLEVSVPIASAFAAIVHAPSSAATPLVALTRRDTRANQGFPPPAG